MQLQSTFGAFLVAFTMVHGAPILPESDKDTDLSFLNEPNMPLPTHSDPTTGKPELPILRTADIIARDPKKSKGAPNEMANAKGAEVGQNAVEGMKAILDDKLDRPNKGCIRKDSKSKDDTEDDDESRLSKLFGGDDDEEASGDEECEDDEDDEDKEDKKDEPKTDKRDLPLRFAPAKRGKPGKGGSSGKPSGGQSDGGSSLGQDILTQTASNVISDGVWYGVDQAVQGAKVKRAPQKGGKGGSSGKSSGGQQDGGSSFGKDFITETGGKLISDGVWFAADQAINQDAKVKRAPQKGGKGGSSGKSSGGQQVGGSSFGKELLKETGGNLVSDGVWWAADQAINQDAKVKRAPQKGTKGGSSGKGTQSGGGSSLGKDIVVDASGQIISDGIWYGVDQAINQDAKVKRAPPKDGKGSSSGKGTQSGGGSSIGQDIATQTTSNLISDGIWYGVDQAVGEGAPVKRSSQDDKLEEAIKQAKHKDLVGGNVYSLTPNIWSGVDEAIAKDAPVKRSPKGGRFRGAGKDIGVDAGGQIISDGIWYGVDQAVGEDAPVKRSPKGGRFRGAGKDIAADAGGQIISDGIWYGVNEATAEDAPVKRSPKGDKFGGADRDFKDGLAIDINSLYALEHGQDALSQATAEDAPVKRSPRGGRGGFGGILGDLFTEGLSFGVDEATNEKRDGLVQRSPRGGRGGFGGILGDLFTEGISFGADQATNEKRDELVQRSPKGGRGKDFGKDVLSGVVSDGISHGIWYGVDEATNAKRDEPAKRSPKGGRGKDFGKDVLTDVVSDGISTGIWYGVDEATNEKRGDVQKRDRSRNKGPSRSSSSSGGSRSPPSDNGSSSSSENDSSNGSGSGGAASGFREGAKDTALEMVQDIGTEAGIYGINSAIDAAMQPQEGEAPVPEEAPAKRALRFSA